MLDKKCFGDKKNKVVQVKGDQEGKGSFGITQGGQMGVTEKLRI